MSLPKVNIRTATLDDLPVLLNFEQEIIKAERPFDVTIKEGPVSYLDHEFYAYLGFMYTDEDFRGMGINALIVEELKTWSNANGLKEIRLTVYNENLAAIKAYEKVGFKKHIIEMRLE